MVEESARSYIAAMRIDPRQDSEDFTQPDLFSVDREGGDSIPVVHPTIFEDDMDRPSSE